MLVLLSRENRFWQARQNRGAGHVFGSSLRWGFQLGKLGAFLSAFPTGFAATGKSLDLKVFVAGFGKLLAGAESRRGRRPLHLAAGDRVVRLSRA